MAYQKTQWNTGDPITQERMNKLEQGVATAQQTAETGISNAATAQSKADANTGEISNLSSAIDTIRRDMTYNNQRIAQGESAWAQVRPAITMNGDNVTKSLLQRFTEDEGKISSLETEVHTARGTQSALVDRLDAIDGITGSIESLKGVVQSINTTFATASNSETYGIPHGSVDARLEYDEAKIKASEDEIALAHSSEAFNRKKQSDVLDTSFTSLDARFEYDEEQIKSNTTAIGNLNTNKINYSDVVADLETNNNMPLAASQGRELKQTIGGSYSSSNTVASGIANAEQNAKDYADGKLGSGFNTTDTVAAAISNLQSTDTSLDERLTTAEGKLTAALTSSVVRTPGANEGDPDTDTTYGSLDARLEAIETHAASVHANVNTIAGELALNGTAIVNTNTRIDGIANEINAAHRTDSDTLDNRFDAIEGRATTLESTIDNQTTGLAATKTIADQALAKANDAATASSVTTLAGRVTALEGKDTSATIIIGKNSITYNSEGIPTNIGTTPIEANDYLLQNTDNKYYYWKYIGESPNGSWELISGAGGGGSGNSNAEDYATRASFEAAAKELNKDYYVLESDGIRHHYRYLSTEVNAEPIEIGITKDKLKSYQIATSVLEEGEGNDKEINQYLDFYGFDFGTNIASTNIDYDDDASYRLAHILLPKGGGGSDSTGYKIYAKLRGDQTQRISLTDATANGINLKFAYTCYSYSEEDGYQYKSVGYTLTRGDGIVVASSNGDIVSHLEVKEASDPTSYTNANSYNIYIEGLENVCETNKTTSFTLTLHSPDDETIRDKSLTVYITVVALTLSSSFSDKQTYSTSNNLQIPYTFSGMSGQEPEFIVTLDGSPIATVITATDINIRSSTLTNRTGIHNLSIKASQTVNGATLYSNILNYQLGLIDSSFNEIMLFSGASLETQNAEQYKILKLPYYLYIPNDGSAAVSYLAEQVTYNNSNEITSRVTVAELNRPTETLSTGSYEYNFRIHEMIADTEYFVVTISCDNKTLQFNVTVKKAEEQINIKTDNLVFDFKPERYSNNVENEADRLWTYENGATTYKMRIPEGAHFDWRTGGWMTVTEGDKEDVSCFCVRAGSRVEFVQETNNVVSPLTLFWQGMEGLGGSNFKCTFKIDNVKTPNAPFLTSLDTETNTIINYGKTILASKQDIEDDETLLHTYLNTKYIHTETFNGSKSIKEAIGTTVLNTEPFSNQITQEMRATAETKAAEKNTKKVKEYISKMYDIVNQASNQEHRDCLLKILAGKDQSATLDYSTIKTEITNYLLVLANAQAVYSQLGTLGADTTSTVYAYRQIEPVNFDALLNGFVVEGKAGKDGIIAMLQFTFVSTIETGGTYVQTISASPISTNSFAKTGTFEVNVTNSITNETKKYEVEMLDEAGNGTYTEIVSIRDASNTETRAYGLELNALGSNIYLPSGVVSYAHSEGDIIEFEYNINPEIQGRVNSSIIIYEDGVPSAAKLYASRNNIFEQTSPGCLTIGSDDCDVYIYKMRLYDRALANEDILANFYADGLTTDDMMDRYERNKNIVNAATITPQLIAEECPDLRVIMIEAPNLTGGKTSFIKNTKIRCIYKNGRPEDNWVALNAYHAGQGTSSDNYGVAGRNLDIMFGFDGEDTVIVPKPQKNNYSFDPTYKSILITGLDDDDTNDILTAAEYETAGYTVQYNGTGKISLTEDSVPNNWFNIKVNIASSENTNNAYLQKRFDRYLKQVYQTPAQKRDDNIKNDMEFFNCVIFIKETGTASEFTEDNNLAVENRPWHFYGIGNLGDSKKTDSTRVNVSGDPYEFCIEISDNGLKNSGFCSGVFYISEQSKKNSQSTNPDLVITHNATIFRVLENGQYTANGNSYTFSIGETPSATTIYAVPVVTDAFTYYRRFMFISGSWTEVGEPITFTRTSYGVKYPISEAEWTTSLNDYHKSLYDTTSGKGWDKSFEFRYDITTKDGETVARNDLEAAMNTLHQQANKIAFADMYSWIVTSTNTEFNSDLDKWFIKESPLYWYLFTERYTMIDSRAKNTFYHYGKVYISNNEYNGTVKAQLEAAQADPEAYAIANNMVEDPSNVTEDEIEIAAEEIKFRLAAATFVYNNRDTFIKEEVDNQVLFNNGYRFDLWDYDNDTALGINNNGQMVFSAGLEDIDKDVSGWIYNEAESVIWRRIRENMYAELGALYVQLKGQCFNAENLIQEFDRMQNEFPEELWRMDFERKYYRPFIEKGETTYLNDMANGRKRYQRRQFERNMAIYINSKYQRNGSYNENDIISFRPQFTWTEGRNTQIIIKPYSTMYINFALGNYDNTGDVTLDTTLSTRVNRGETYIINAADYIHDYNNIQCIIYNASRIMELDGLGNFECKQFILGAAKKLSVLKLGSAEYPNRSMADINNMGLSDGLPLLEELDLTNIQFGMAPDTFALDNFPLLKRLNATGCNIRSFTFKDGGMLEQIIFPDVLTKIEFKNLYNLVDTEEGGQTINAVTLTGAANLTSYNSVNSYSNSYQIVQNMLNNAGLNRITQLKLNDVDWTIGDINDLELLVQLQNKLQSNMYLAGVVHVTGVWSEIERDSYAGTPTSVWPDLRLYCTGTQQTKWPVTYQHTSYTLDDGTVVQEENIRTIYINDGAVAPDIYYTGVIDMPTQPSDVRHNYTFGRYDSGDYIPYSGWTLSNSSTSLSNGPVIHEPTVLQTYFSTTTRTYPIKWYLNADKTGLIKTSDPVEYEAGVDQEAPSIIDIHNLGYSTATVSINNSNNTASYSIFKGWQELPNKIHPSANDTSFNIYGDWETAENVDLGAMFNENNIDNLTPEQLLVLSAMTDEQKRRFNIYNKIEDCVTRCAYTTGQDSIKEGTLLVGTTTNPIYRADRDRGVIRDGLATTVQPFKAGNDAFTIAIDYSFNPEFVYNHGDTSRNSPKMGVLASCYERNVTANTAGGFVLYYNLNSSVGAFGPRLGFGNIFGTDKEASNQSVELGQATTAQYRNIIVLRHPAGSNSLYIYSGMSEKDSLPQEVTITSITWNNFNSDMYLRFGCLIDQNSLTDDANYSDLKDTVDYGGGTIYWAKYWNEDLGRGECKRLAIWPHEKMTYLLTHLNTSATSGMRANPTSQAPIPSITLTSLTASIHGIVAMEDYQASNVTPVSWSIASLRTLMNKRVFLGLPTKLQAIMCKGQVANMEMYKDGQSYRINNNQLVYTRDYLYAPSKSNVVRSYTNGTTDYSQEENEVFRPYSYIDTTNLELKQWSANSDTWVDYTDASAYAYLNLRFAAVPLTWSNKLRVYIDTNENITSLSGKLGNIVREGDIYISGNTTAGQAYMYISDTTRRNTGVQVASSAKFNMGDGNNVGGWTPSYPYWLRSMSNAGGVQNRSNYYYILPTGYVIEQPPRLKGSANISYSIAI